MLSLEQTEKLVILIASGRNSYADIKRSFPEIPDDELITHVTAPITISPAGKSPQLLLILVTPPMKLTGNYHFNPNDRFALTIQSEDILYRLKKEYSAEKQFNDTLTLNKQIRFMTGIGLLISLASLIATIIS